MPSRSLGLVVMRGPNVVLISPTDGSAGMSSAPFELSLTARRDTESIRMSSCTGANSRLGLGLRQPDVRGRAHLLPTDERRFWGDKVFRGQQGAKPSRQLTALRRPNNFRDRYRYLCAGNLQEGTLNRLSSTKPFDRIWPRAQCNQNPGIFWSGECWCFYTRRL